MEITSHIVTTPPRDAATVILLRDGAPGLEVFLMRRAEQSGVLGGAYVFPGGKLDDADVAQAQALLSTVDAERCRRQLGEPDLSHALAVGLHLAAVREAAEECGVQLGLDALVPWSRWVTPRQASLMNKRFDTRFFVAALPPAQEAVHDNFETTASEWMTPRQALTRYWVGEFDMAPPQIMSLVQLNRFVRADDVLHTARSAETPTIEPEPFDEDGCRTICYPGDSRHSVVNARLPGPTRLTFRNRRFEPPGGTLAELLG
jgi:8-oxo-dGTP pyrophosphatase MutT (NUDIX family)